MTVEMQEVARALRTTATRYHVGTSSSGPTGYAATTAMLTTTMANLATNA